ncbi:hypothetical protein CARUB_v10016208mg [Capsella rubella]|uniref:F-box domain-containing protein n=1 Tax=Capsella rubella TaxID=81985 RepID=R0GB09_9BRAS|nr:hypothetical protein CARUB_v10016208mg [Capsella rubella]
MAHEEKLPFELTEEILSRVPQNSLVRFRSVSKQWNALFDDRTFINNHKKTFRFILTTKYKIYSVSIDPKIEVRDLTLDIPGLESQIPKNLVDCDKLLLCDMEKGAAVWNPWLRQARLINQDLDQTQIQSYGIGYNNKGSYKVVASCGRKGVSLNGNLYWVCYYDKTDPVYHLTKFNSCSERFFRFCYLNCGTTNFLKDVLVLRVFNGDRFSLLKQCHATKKIEIWVNKYKINSELDNEENMEWIKFMEMSSPNLPDLVETRFNSPPSYFIEDKRLVVCSCDETGRAWIYVLGQNKLISKTQIHSLTDLWPSHCTFIPSLVPVPRGGREEVAELQV